MIEINLHPKYARENNHPPLPLYRQSWYDGLLDFLVSNEIRASILGLAIYGLTCGFLGGVFVLTWMRRMR